MIKNQIKHSSNNSGVYQFFDKNDQVLYVGKAKNLKKRLANYADSKRLSARIARMVELAVRIETIETKTESEALLLECNLIKKLKPRYNILLRDDKSFPYILITDHEFGQITKHRGRRVNKGSYFGPFASATDVNQTIDILKKSFLLRSCADAEFARRKKPCMEYQIKRCSAPCVGLIEKKSYTELEEGAINFLNGKESKIQEQLAKKMQQHSQDLEYEKAVTIRERIKALSSIQAKQNINLLWLKDADVITLATTTANTNPLEEQEQYASAQPALKEDLQMHGDPRKAVRGPCPVKNKDSSLACIHISFFRSGYNYGSKPYFINTSEDQTEEEIISAFLGQFYLEQSLPKTLILSHKPQDLKITNQLLNQIAHQNIKIIVPRKGDKYKLIQDHLKVAEEQLHSKLNSQANIKKSLLELKTLLDLPKIPERIEIYDNSHTSGQDMVGAMVVAGAEGFIKSAYRKFNTKAEALDKKDDTAMLKQVLLRRFKRIGEEKWVKPDLLIIDGGKGQLSAAEEVFKELELGDINYICMSKGPNRNAGEEYFHRAGKESFTLPKTHPLMYYLQTLRDEAHRFAIGTHRAKRAKSITKSELDGIKDIGKKRKMLLLQHFGSVAAIKEASVEDMCRIDGVSKNVAQKIKDYFE